MAGKVGKPVLAQVNKMKRQERLEEIDEILRVNKEQQDNVTRKLDEARSVDNTVKVSINLLGVESHCYYYNYYYY